MLKLIRSWFELPERGDLSRHRLYSHMYEDQCF
jgi:hypothetical protein